jgi:radical SAM superfamily enzyme YgiQ (UPF0313 family)
LKVVFVNPPVVRFGDSSPEHDSRLDSSLSLKILSFNKYNKIDLLNRAVSHLVQDSGFRFGVRAGSRWPFTMNVPIGALHYPFIMAYAASYLKSEGFEVNLIDSVADEEYSYKNFLKNLKKEKADIVVIECSTPTIDIDLWMAKEISKFSEVALAGPHLVSQAELLKKQNPWIKYFLKGEYIKSSLLMAKSRKSGIYDSEVVKNLDEIPFAFRDYASSKKYYDSTMPTPKPQLQVYGSKGCPFRCTYCMWPSTMYNRIVAIREPKKIAKEIKLCVKKYGFKSIFFDDDTFNVGGNDRMLELCKELKKIGLPWTMMGRLDCSPLETYEKMVDAGCVGMRFGVESFDPIVLKNINKALERSDFVKTLEHLSTKYPQVMIHLTMMKDLPGQTEESHKRDIEILKKLGYFPGTKFRNFQLSSCVPFPGTELYAQLEKEKGKAALDKFSLYDGSKDTVMKTFKK